MVSASTLMSSRNDTGQKKQNWAKSSVGEQVILHKPLPGEGPVMKASHTVLCVQTTCQHPGWISPQQSWLYATDCLRIWYRQQISIATSSSAVAILC